MEERSLREDLELAIRDQRAIVLLDDEGEKGRVIHPLAIVKSRRCEALHYMTEKHGYGHWTLGGLLYENRVLLQEGSLSTEAKAWAHRGGMGTGWSPVVVPKGWEDAAERRKICLAIDAFRNARERLEGLTGGPTDRLCDQVHVRLLQLGGSADDAASAVCHVSRTLRDDEE